MNRSLIFFLVFTLTFYGKGYTQSTSKKQLEARRLKLEKEIKEANSILTLTNNKQKSVSSQVEDLMYKINIRKNLIRVTNDQANLLSRLISKNTKEVNQLTVQLELLKKDYAEMVVKSYKSRSVHSRLMFLFSSENFKQAYKRLQYFEQYKLYQKNQAEIIKSKSLELNQLNAELKLQQDEKKSLIEKNREVNLILEEELKQQNILITDIKKDIGKYRASINRKQREIEKLDKQIEKLIKEAIAASNKKKGSKRSSSFTLTPEAKALAASFESNKGKLPWPVKKGIVKVKYGTQPSPIDPSIKIRSNGIRIATEPAAKVKAIFKGEVLAIHLVKRGNPSVLIRHGNYISVYKNLSKIYVKKGQIIETNQEIGQVFTNPNSGESILNFSLFKDGSTQNPMYWIMRI
ncbi:MAG: murein hydrolase activator EnvC family protein [Flavobacteriaceae bacterium]